MGRRRLRRIDANIADFLAAAFETSDLKDLPHALATIVRARGVTEIAGAASFARGSLYEAIGEGTNPTLATLFFDAECAECEPEGQAVGGGLTQGRRS